MQAQVLMKAGEWVHMRSVGGQHGRVGSGLVTVRTKKLPVEWNDKVGCNTFAGRRGSRYMWYTLTHSLRTNRLNCTLAAGSPRY